VGRANATTAEEQAVADAESKVRKQLDKSHYAENIQDVDKLKFVKVMLATSYEKVKDKMTFDGAMISPKLDGLRWVASKDHSHSRSGKPLGGMNLIRTKLDKMFNDHPELVLDGEGYSHEYHDNFSKVLKLIKRQTISDEQAKEILAVLKYHVYDVLYVNDLTPSDPYIDRYEAFFDILNEEYPELTEYIKMVPYFDCKNHENIQAFHDLFIEQGYEGAIVRYNRGYDQKRSKHLIKVKVFEDKEFKIIEILEGQGNRSKMAGKIAVWLDEPRAGEANFFKSGIKGGEEFYKELWDQRYDLIGKTATIRFFGRGNDTNIPRFPVTVAVAREDFE
jgi:ATP-dependent DNA ligase